MSGGRIRCPRLEEGVYHYDPSTGEWKQGPPRSGYSLLVFVNLFCSKGCERAIRLIEQVAGKLIEEGKLGLGLVVCTRFKRFCLDKQARGLFASYNVFASPTVVVLHNGTPIASFKGSLRVEEDMPRFLRHLAAELKAGLHSTPPIS